MLFILMLDGGSLGTPGFKQFFQLPGHFLELFCRS